jgi:hypothetical protein
VTRPLLVLLLALAAPAIASDDAPRVPNLETEPPPVPAPGRDEPAVAVPRTIAVCRESKGDRCWTAPGEPDCRAAPGGIVYRTVIDTPADVAQALAQCRTGEGR